MLTVKKNKGRVRNYIKIFKMHWNKKLKIIFHMFLVLIVHRPEPDNILWMKYVWTENIFSLYILTPDLKYLPS